MIDDEGSLRNTRVLLCIVLRLITETNAVVDAESPKRRGYTVYYV